MALVGEIATLKDIRGKAAPAWKKLELKPAAGPFLVSEKGGMTSLSIPENLKVAEPITVLFEAAVADSPFVFEPRISIRLGKNSFCRVIVRYQTSPKAQYLSDLTCEAHLEPGAGLEYLEIKTPPENGFHASSSRFHLKSQSRLSVFSFVKAAGAAAGREEVSVFLEGEGAKADLKGLSVLTQNTRFGQEAGAFHQAPHCESRQFYKNILSQNAQAEFDSLVSVNPGAFGTDSNQMNRNLLLSDQAQVHSRPQLRIDADDVVCVHGSATGQIQKDELFYLRTRGFSEKLARLVLVEGFAEEILQSIDDAPLRQELEDLVKRTLEKEVTVS
jgi:Fe-S cluster assembly protein SufD